MTKHRRPVSHADEFIREYPKTKPARLEWLESNLGISRRRLLRLMGLSLEETDRSLALPWEAIMERWQEPVTYLLELLEELIAFFRYDWRKLAEHLRRATQPTGDAAGDLAAPPPRHRGRLQSLPPNIREEVLLTILDRGGPDTISHLLEYLEQPEEDFTTP